MNRAVHGDDVAVMVCLATCPHLAVVPRLTPVLPHQLLPRSEWQTPGSAKSLLHDVADRDDVSSARTKDRAALAGTQGSTSGVPCGRVVGIFQRNWRAYVATLVLGEGSTATTKDRAEMVVPMDVRIPKIRIRTRLGTEILNHR